MLLIYCQASEVVKLPPGYVYGGPNSKDAFESVPCKCNTVVYSVLAACGICQIGNSNVKAIDALVYPSFVLQSSNQLPDAILPGGRYILATARTNITQRGWITTKPLIAKWLLDHTTHPISAILNRFPMRPLFRNGHSWT